MVARRRFTRLRLIRWIHAPYTVAPSQGTGPKGWNMAGNKPTDGSFWRPCTVAPPPEVLQSTQEQQEQGRAGGSKRSVQHWPPVPLFSRVSPPRKVKKRATDKDRGIAVRSKGRIGWLGRGSEWDVERHRRLARKAAEAAAKAAEATSRPLVRILTRTKADVLSGADTPPRTTSPPQQRPATVDAPPVLAAAGTAGHSLSRASQPVKEDGEEEEEEEEAADPFNKDDESDKDSGEDDPKGEDEEEEEAPMLTKKWLDIKARLLARSKPHRVGLVDIHVKGLPTWSDSVMGDAMRTAFPKSARMRSWSRAGATGAYVAAPRLEV